LGERGRGRLSAEARPTSTAGMAPVRTQARDQEAGGRPAVATRRLSSADVDAVTEAVVRRLAQVLAPGSTDGAMASADVMTAAQVARDYGVSPAWVRAHAADLGAYRLGNGPRPRLRFDPRLVATALGSGVDADTVSGAADCSATARSTGKRSQPPDRPQRRRQSSVQQGVTASGSPLLPVRGSIAAQNSQAREAISPRVATTKEGT
jgi:hypothetical protein